MTRIRKKTSRAASDRSTRIASLVRRMFLIVMMACLAGCWNPLIRPGTTLIQSDRQSIQLDGMRRADSCGVSVGAVVTSVVMYPFDVVGSGCVAVYALASENVDLEFGVVGGLTAFLLPGVTLMLPYVDRHAVVQVSDEQLDRIWTMLQSVPAQNDPRVLLWAGAGIADFKSVRSASLRQGEALLDVVDLRDPIETPLLEVTVDMRSREPDPDTGRD